MTQRLISRLELIFNLAKAESNLFIPSETNNFRPKFLTSRVLVWIILALFILKIITVPFLIYFPKSALFGDISKTALIELLNQDRKEADLGTLKENNVLDNAAALKAQDMLTKDYFAHQSPEGVSPWYWFKLAGYNYNIAGENLAIGFLDSSEVNQAWLDSPLHKANLLNPNYKDVGIAILAGDFQGNETTVVVQLFGTQKQTVSGPKVQTAPIINDISNGAGEQAPAETVAPAESAEKETAETSTLVSEIKSIAKEVKPALKTAGEKVTFNSLSFFSSDYHKVLQIIIYGFLGLIILALIINIFVRIDIQHFDLILKALGFIAILILFILVDKGAIMKLIPHSFRIY